MTRLRRPCDNCPWRLDAHRGHWAADHFTSIWHNCQDDGIGTMLCHKAAALPEPKRSHLVCQGWARVLGGAAIGVRMAFIRGLVTLAEIEDRGGPALFKSFKAMLRANGVRPPTRNRFIPKRTP